MTDNDNVTVNAATCKKFLIGSGMRCSHSGLIAFQKLLNETAIALAAKAAENTKAKKRKTIMAEDILAIEDADEEEVTTEE